ncbi:MAG: YbhB/YbcL family Raf kinase inhibitor-like protein [Terracidiphilus sp.]|nr:YbhB/YbcL family Raf kinase inhibitor-like protein [Terracidiphilus sp.]
MRKLRSICLVLTASLLLTCGCRQTGFSGQTISTVAEKTDPTALQGGSAMSFRLQSTAFANGDAIPRKYTCEGADLSPALSWDGIPAGTHSLALIADDPDAPMGTWTHWVIWNIPAQAAGLAEGVAKAEVLENGARQGRNDFKRVGYGGPCPPPGKAHRYFFKLYALDSMLSVKVGASRNEVEADLKRHVLAKTEWMGTYRR